MRKQEESQFWQDEGSRPSRRPQKVNFEFLFVELSRHHSHHSSSLSNGSPFKYIKFKREKVSDSSNLSLISCFITPDFWIVIILIRPFLLEEILEEKNVFVTVFCVY